MEHPDLFDDYVLIFSRYFLYYLEYNGDGTTTPGKNTFSEDLRQQVKANCKRLAEVQESHIEMYLTEGQRAQKEVEQSYIML